MSKHTPGPWVIKGTLFGEWNISSEYSVAGKKLENGRQHIANSPSASSKLNPDYFAMFMANAQLIAAAPDLLEALEELTRINHLHNESIKVVLSAPEGWCDSYLDKARAAIAKARGEA